MLCCNGRKNQFPPRRLVSTHVKPVRVYYNVFLERGLEAGLQWLQLHKSGGHTHLRAEHFKKWIQEEYLDEGGSTPPLPPQAGAMTEADGDHSVHVSAQGDPKLTSVDYPSPDTKR